MKANTKSFIFLQNTYPPIRIPFFQRGYVWNEDNWRDLLWDLEKNNGHYYLGSIVIKTMNQHTNEPYTLLIDGQQRLTTLSILLRVLYKYITINENDIAHHAFHICLFYQDQHINKKTVRLQQSNIDRYDFEEIINTGTHQRLNEDNVSNIIKCCKFFTNAIEAMNEAKRKQIFENILASHNECFILIELDEFEDEQKIFDSINATGMHLSSADIVKNFFFQRLYDMYNKTFPERTKTEQENYIQNIYKNYWESIFLNNQETRDFWSRGRRIGHLTRDNLEILLHSVALIEGIFYPGQNKFDNLSSLYKKYFIDQCTSLDKMVNFLKSMKSYAMIYREKICQIHKDSLLGFDNFERRLLHIMEVTDTRAFYAYILYLYKKFEYDYDRLKLEFQKLEKYIIYYFICRILQKMSNNNLLCGVFLDDFRKYDNCNKLDQLLQCIGIQQFQESLRNIKIGNINDNTRAKLILFWIELYRRKKSGYYGINELKYSKYTIEHIMPQKWTQYWQDIDVLDDDNHVITDPQLAIEYRNQMVNNLGNLTLLSGKLNTALQNRSFKEKICGLSDNKKNIPGIKDYAELDITKHDIVLPYDNGETVWNEKRIRERCEKLIEDALAIWS